VTTASVDDIGARINQHLASSVGARNYELWFSETTIRVEHGRVALNAPHRFAADWIATHFRQSVHEAVRETVGQEVEVRIEADPDACQAAAARDAGPPVNPAPRSAVAADGPAAGRGADPPAPAPQSAQPATALPAPTPGLPNGKPTPNAAAPPPNAHPNAAAPSPAPRARPATRPKRGPNQPLRHRLEDFVVGDCNDLAYKAGLRLIDDDVNELNPLFVHGACGVGKTHLLQGLSRRFSENRPGRRWRYCTAEQFTNEYIDAVRTNQLPAFRARLRGLSLLVVDDVHFLSNKKGTQSEFLHTFDSIDLHGAKLVLASDCHPKLIGKLNEALVSRCVRGMVVEMEQPDRQTRGRLVEALAARRGLKLEPGVVPLLAEQAGGSVREIEGTLTTLKALALAGRDPAEADAPVGRALLARVLGHHAARRPQPVRFETILQQVCDHLDVDRQAVLNGARRRQVVLARSLAIYLARQMTPLSFPELASALGKSNHSSIITAQNRIRERIELREPITIDPQRGPTTVDQLAQNLRHRIETAPD